MIVGEGYIPRPLGRNLRVCTLRPIPYQNNIPRPFRAGLLIGHINEYPEYPTQAFSIDELETNLQDIYSMIQNGTLEIWNSFMTY